MIWKTWWMEKQPFLKTNDQCIKKLPRIELDAFWLLYQDNIQTFYGVFLELLMMECYLFSWKYHMTEKVMSYSMPFFRFFGCTSIGGIVAKPRCQSEAFGPKTWWHSTWFGRTQKSWHSKLFSRYWSGIWSSQALFWWGMY